MIDRFDLINMLGCYSRLDDLNSRRLFDVSIDTTMQHENDSAYEEAIADS